MFHTSKDQLSHLEITWSRPQMETSNGPIKPSSGKESPNVLEGNSSNPAWHASRANMTSKGTQKGYGNARRKILYLCSPGPHGRKACPGSWCSLCRDRYATTARLQQITPKSSDTPPASEESPHVSVRSARCVWKHRHGTLGKTLKITCSGNGKCPETEKERVALKKALEVAIDEATERRISQGAARKVATAVMTRPDYILCRTDRPCWVSPPVVFVVGPVRDEHRRGVESHAAVLERSLRTSDLESQRRHTDLRILANGQKSFAVGIAVLAILDLISKSE
jgi:hypothetical protein